MLEGIDLKMLGLGVAFLLAWFYRARLLAWIPSLKPQPAPSPDNPDEVIFVPDETPEPDDPLKARTARLKRLIELEAQTEREMAQCPETPCIPKLHKLFVEHIEHEFGHAAEHKDNPAG